jgi:uncharacterized repeat protein (TIGR01451 family)
MRPISQHLTTAARLACLLLALAGLLPLAATPATAAVADQPGDSFASAVPCLTAEDSFATTCFADTIFSSPPADDPAGTRVGLATKSPLALLGTRGPRSSDRMRDGVGSVYGLAYDDGAHSGQRRLFMAAYTKRLSSFGPAGPGGVYVYNLGSSQIDWPQSFSVPDAGWGRTADGDLYDVGALAHVGRSGLGDMEISPDGRELFIVNLAARRIERYDITGTYPVRLAPLTVDDGRLDTNDALDAVWSQFRGRVWYSAALESGDRADTVPFALEFLPQAAGDEPLLFLGLTDTNRNGVRDNGRSAPVGSTHLHVVAYRVGSSAPQPWVHALSQNLDTPEVEGRMEGSRIAAWWGAEEYAGQRTRGWNPWHENLSAMPGLYDSALGYTVLYPQPLLADIEFTHGGQRMFLGLRDRTGDLVFAAAAPPGHHSTMAQGDTLVYNRSGAAWALATPARPGDPVNFDEPGRSFTPAPSDFFNDNIHSYPVGSDPVHVENHGGALATAIQGDGRTIAERIATTAIFGGRRSGLAFYGQEGGQVGALNTIISASPYAGGKAAALGDLEPLCTYAFVSGRVWHDRDGDGAQEPGEPGIPGVELELFRGDPATAPADATAITDSEGGYRFALPPNRAYRIRIDAGQRAAGGSLSGYRFTPARRAAGDTTRDSDAAEQFGYVEFEAIRPVPGAGTTGLALPAPAREQELANIDIGLTQLPGPGVIGDRVWQDLDGDGFQDAGEPGLPANLLAAMSFTLVPSPSTPIILPAPAAPQRLGDGRYRFTNLPPGSYAVRFGNLPTGYSVTRLSAGNGANDAIDSDAAAPALQTRFVPILSEAPVEERLDLGLVPDRTDLEVTLSASPSVLVGGAVTYTVTARNLSPSRQALSVSVGLDLPAGTGVAAASSLGGVTPAITGAPFAAGQRVTWATLAALNPGEARTATVSVTAPAALEPPSPAGTLVASAAGVTLSPETSTANNSATASTALVRPEVSITKSGPAAALAGDELSYSLTYHNSGSAPAAGVVVADPLPAGLAFVRFTANPGGACAYTQADRTVRCSLGSLAHLAPGNRGTVAFTARLDAASAATSVTNTATISTGTNGDSPANNSASLTSAIAWPDPGVSVELVAAQPQPPGASFPVGTRGELRVRYGNGLSAPPPGELLGTARSASLTVTLTSGDLALGPLPPGCSFAAPRVSCALGDLAPGAAGTLRFPIDLPATFAPDRLGATAAITTASPERPASLGDNTASAGLDIVRPNVFVDAAAPAGSVARGSVFWYTVEYGNIHRQAPALTRAADSVTLRVTLPPDVELLQAEAPPSRIEGRALTWELGRLAPRATGQVVLVVRARAGGSGPLRLDASVSTTTPGDSPLDNSASVTTAVVEPPSAIPQSAGVIALALRSELDPNSRDGDPLNGVVLAEGTRFSWPAGEILGLTPRLRELTIEGEADLPYPYAYRARVVGWSLRAVTAGDTSFDPAGADSRGRTGCRPGATPAARPSLLEGCTYGYVGGESLEAIRAPAPLREEQLRDQAAVYWTRPPAPPQRPGVYLYAVEPLGRAGVTVQVEVEIQIVNAAPGVIGGVPLPEEPLVPLPDPERRLFTERFEVTLIVPRSVVAPGGP